MITAIVLIDVCKQGGNNLVIESFEASLAPYFNRKYALRSKPHYEEKTSEEYILAFMFRNVWKKTLEVILCVRDGLPVKNCQQMHQ
jgi:hypothetical protein